MTDIVVPTLGESVSEATVAKWMKKAGDTVRKDETLFERETRIGATNVRFDQGPRQHQGRAGCSNVR
jgi:2-oxoglutarate dehydrogenase E2 component (dihydrolipoamide succinyltransferase)